MTQAAVPTAPEAPAEETVSIELGPDTQLYPERLLPVAAPPTEPPAPESDDAGAPEPAAPDAGPDKQGSRRAKGEDAYQRGLREGEERARQLVDERRQSEAVEKAQRDWQAHIDKLYTDLESPDYDTRENAGKELSTIVKNNRLQAAFEVRGRNAALQEIVDSFKSVKDIEGIGEDGLTELWASPNPGELAKKAFTLGQKQAKAAADERIAELEAKLTEANGKRVGSSLTPERSNGSSAGSLKLSLDQYQRMSARDLRKAGITSADIDAMTAEMQAEAARGR